jgi:predicted PurR-regulated permease PerM
MKEAVRLQSIYTQTESKAMNERPLLPAEPADEDGALFVVDGPAMTTAELSQTVVAVAAVLFCLQWGKAFIVPLLLGILISYSLRIPVRALEKLRVPRIIGAAFVMALVSVLIASAGYSMRQDALVLVEQLPGAAETIRNMVHGGATKGQGVLAKIGKAATELESAATEAAGGAPATKAPAPQNVAPGPGFVKQFLLVQTSSALAALLQLGAALVIAFFLLAAGDTFRRKLVRRAGASLARRRATVEMLNQIDTHIQRYMLATILVNLLIGLVSWGFYYWVGVERPMVLGALAGAMHLFPYVGSSFAGTVAGTAGLLQSSDPKFALMLAGGTVFIALTIGFLFNTWLQGYTFKMNSAVVIVGVLFFGWLWGAWGIFLAVPLLAVIKTVCERIPPWGAVAEFLAG